MIEQLKIALCYSGQPRTWRHCLESQLAYFEGADISIFLHLWDEVRPDELGDILTQYAPADVFIEPRPDFSAQHRQLATLWPVTPTPFVFDMAYGIQQALGLALNNGQTFDTIVRMRYDTLYRGRMNWQAVDPQAVNVANWGHAACVDDLFAVGAPEVMGQYARFYDWLCQNLERFENRDTPGMLKPEMALQQFLHHRGVPVNVLGPHDFKIVRPGMVGRPFDLIRNDIQFQVEKIGAINACLQDAGADVRHKHKYIDIYPFKAMQTKIIAYSHAVGPEVMKAVWQGCWADRLLALEAMAVTIMADRCAKPELGYEDLELVRLMITAVLDQISDVQHLDVAGYVLKMCSLEMVDQRQGLAWQTQQKMDLAVALDQQGLIEAAPVILATLQHSLRLLQSVGVQG